MLDHMLNDNIIINILELISITDYRLLLLVDSTLNKITNYVLMKKVKDIPAYLDFHYTEDPFEIIHSMIYLGTFKEQIPYLIEHPLHHGYVYGRTLRISTEKVIKGITRYPFVRLSNITIDVMDRNSLDSDVDKIININVLTFIQKGNLSSNVQDPPVYQSYKMSYIP